MSKEPRCLWCGSELAHDDELDYDYCINPNCDYDEYIDDEDNP